MKAYIIVWVKEGMMKTSYGQIEKEGFTTVRWNHAQSTWLAGAADELELAATQYGLEAEFGGATPDLNDSFRTVQFQIVPGTYTLNVVGTTSNNKGLATFYLDGSLVSFGSMDFYRSGGGNTSVIKTVSGVVIQSSPNNSHYIRVVVSKNPSSSGYTLRLGEMWFQ